MADFTEADDPNANNTALNYATGGVYTGTGPGLSTYGGSGFSQSATPPTPPPRPTQQPTPTATSGGGAPAPATGGNAMASPPLPQPRNVPPTMGPGSTDQNSGGAVSTLQGQLNTLGYYTGAIDGLYGPRTADAVKRLNQGYYPTASIGPLHIAGPQTHVAVNDLLSQQADARTTSYQSPLQALNHPAFRSSQPAGGGSALAGVATPGLWNSMKPAEQAAAEKQYGGGAPLNPQPAGASPTEMMREANRQGAADQRDIEASQGAPAGSDHAANLQAILSPYARTVAGGPTAPSFSGGQPTPASPGNAPARPSPAAGAQAVPANVGPDVTNKALSDTMGGGRGIPPEQGVVSNFTPQPGTQVTPHSIDSGVARGAPNGPAPPVAPAAPVAGTPAAAPGTLSARTGIVAPAVPALGRGVAPAASARGFTEQGNPAPGQQSALDAVRAQGSRGGGMPPAQARAAPSALGFTAEDSGNVPTELQGAMPAAAAAARGEPISPPTPPQPTPRPETTPQQIASGQLGWGAVSPEHLVGVDSRLVAAADYAAQKTGERYHIPHEGGGTRTQAEADANAKAGIGVKHSLHIADANGVGHAFDIVTVGKDGKEHYASPAFAAAMQEYGTQHGYTVRWGNQPGFIHSPFFGGRDPSHFDLGLNSRGTGEAYSPTTRALAAADQNTPPATAAQNTPTTMAETNVARGAPSPARPSPQSALAAAVGNGPLPKEELTTPTFTESGVSPEQIHAAYEGKLYRDWQKQNPDSTQQDYERYRSAQLQFEAERAGPSSSALGSVTAGGTPAPGGTPTKGYEPGAGYTPPGPVSQTDSIHQAMQLVGLTTPSPAASPGLAEPNRPPAAATGGPRSIPSFGSSGNPTEFQQAIHQQIASIQDPQQQANVAIKMSVISEAADQTLAQPDGPARVQAWNSHLDQMQQLGVLDPQTAQSLRNNPDEATLRQLIAMGAAVHQMIAT